MQSYELNLLLEYLKLGIFKFSKGINSVTQQYFYICSVKVQSVILKTVINEVFLNIIIEKDYILLTYQKRLNDI